MIAVLIGLFFVLGTVFFFKCPPVLLVFLSGAALWRAWRQPDFRLSQKPFLYWGIAAVVLGIHTAFFAANLPLSLNHISRFLGALLLIAWLSSFLSSQQGKPFPFPLNARTLLWLCWLSIAGILIQFWGEGLLTRGLSNILNWGGWETLIVPRTLKTHLAILMVGFFVFLGVEQTRKFPIYALGFGVLGIAIILKFYTAILAFTCAMVVFVGAQILPRTTWIISTVSMVSSFFLLPRIVTLLWKIEKLHLGQVPIHLNTLSQRLAHWHDILPFIQQNFWFGNGLGGSRLICPTPTFKLPLQIVHNMNLEIWLEMGFLGVCLGSAALATLLWRIKDIQNPHAYATSLSFVVFIFIINQASYNDLHIWWLSSYSLGGLSLYWLFKICQVKDGAISRGRASSETRTGTPSRMG